MDRDPGDFEKRDGDPPGVSAEDARLDALLASLPPAPGIPYIDDDNAEDDARALADVAAGRVHDHAIVGRWLRTWGKPGQKPFRDWLADQDG